MRKNSPAVDAALLLLNKGGQGYTPEDILLLSKTLKKERAFGYARRILSIARTDKTVDHKKDLALLLDQQCALCTYKDQDLPVADRLDDALLIIRDGRPDLDHTTVTETLGLGGAIYKRKWETDGQRRNLEASLSYYRKGYEQHNENDRGYTGINAAFALDLLAQIEVNETIQSPEQLDKATAYKQEAETIRKDLIENLTRLLAGTEKEEYEKDWWLLATIAEAYFGLGDYEMARPWLKRGMALERIEEWERESTTRQLARIALIHEDKEPAEIEASSAWQVLKELISNPDDEVAALQSAFSGKIGLALSGGGFRASLYHIGVLARLAELDMLRRVEIFSCVSGGSIIGAHLYLHIRHLLQTKTDSVITGQDYIDIIQTISTEFLAGVQRNIRTRVIASWWDNFKMLWNKNYSRTNRVGELYEKELFSKVKDGSQDKERWLNNLYIYPKLLDGTMDESFNPKYDNWRRKAKVPVLILNATTLNSGHNWQFTASWMGESPASIQKIDGNYRLRRMYYKEDGDKASQRVIRLGHAVAASSCVPGMFEPLALPDLYENKVVRLVDGGVHDNQGICGLLEQDCSVMLVSDASGQMGEVDDPGSDVLSAPLRANDILMERVRNAQYQDMNSRLRAGLLKGFMFIHLKMGLDVKSVDWINCEDPSEDDGAYKPEFRVTAYNIRKDVQKKLAAVRTDLDSFNDTEAFALMTSGYLMTEYEYARCLKQFSSGPAKQVQWDFLIIANDLERPDTPKEVIALLDIAKEKVFKIWKITPALRVLSWILLFLTIAGIIWAVIRWHDKSLLTLGEAGWSVFYIVLGFFISKTIIRIIRYRDTAIRFATGLGLITVGWLVATLHLLVFDQLYLKKGKRKQDA